MGQTQPAKKTFALYDAGGDLGKKWFVYWYEAGKRVRKYGHINREQTAEGRRAAAAALVAQLEKEYQPPPENAAQKKQLYDALDAYRHHLRAKSYQSYRWKLNHLFQFLKNEPVNRENLEHYFRHAVKVQSAATVHNTRRMFVKLLKLAGIEHILQGIEVPKGHSKPLQYFQPHQARQLCRWMEAHDPTLLLWCQFVYYCFLRPRSELRFLKVGDIYFHEKKIVVPGRIAKNKKTEAVVIPDAFAPSLEHLKEMPPGAFLFPGKQPGKPTGYNAFGNRHRAMLEHLGYDADLYGVYSWKHTGAVAAYRAGIGLVELQLQLRHHSLDQVKSYLRQLRVEDFENLRREFPAM